MRIRKEVSPRNVKMFMRIALFTSFFFCVIVLLFNFLEHKPLFAFSYHWIFIVLFYPLILASVYSSASRKITLYINDHQNIDSFRTKLTKTILSKNVEESNSVNNVSLFAAKGWFYRLFNNWDRSETVSVKWENEVVIEGSARIVSQIEDSLTWNTAFR